MRAGCPPSRAEHCAGPPGILPPPKPRRAAPSVHCTAALPGLATTGVCLGCCTVVSIIITGGLAPTTPVRNQPGPGTAQAQTGRSDGGYLAGAAAKASRPRRGPVVVWSGWRSSARLSRSTSRVRHRYTEFWWTNFFLRIYFRKNKCQCAGGHKNNDVKRITFA